MSAFNLKYMIVDCETTGLDPRTDKLHGTAVLLPDGRAAYYPVWSTPLWVRASLGNERIPKIGHKFRFDTLMLEAAGLPVNGPLICTMQLALMVDENAEAGLKALTEKYFGASQLSAKAALDAKLAELKLKHVGQLCALDLADASHPYFDIISAYAIEDITNTKKLYTHLNGIIRQKDEAVRRVFKTQRGPIYHYTKEITPTERALIKVEQQGIGVDEAVFKQYGDELRDKQAAVIDELEVLFSAEVAEWEEAAYHAEVATKKKADAKARVRIGERKYGTEFLWGSADHLGWLIYEKLGVPARRTPKGRYSVDYATMQTLASSTKNARLLKLFELFGKFQDLKKELSTYVTGYLKHVVNGRIHASFLQETGTGRTNCVEPNLQNIPRTSPVKKAFKPKPGHIFVYGDYSQVELRIAAHLSQDPQMISTFSLGEDPHRLTAAAVFNKRPEDVTDVERQAGKTINFLIIYDGGPMRLQEELASNGLNFSKEQCKEFRANFFAKHKKYRQFLDDVLATLKQRGCLVSEMGRVRRLPDYIIGQYVDYRRQRFTGPAELRKRLLKAGETAISDREAFDRAGKKWAHVKKQAFNFPVQSLGASITKAAIRYLQRAGFNVVLTVHDSIIIELPIEQLEAAVPRIQKLLENSYPLSVPLKADVKILNSLNEKDIYARKETQTVSVATSNK